MQHYHLNPNSGPVLSAPVHCECALISYLLNEDISPPPFSYVGTSELCFPRIMIITGVFLFIKF